MPEKFPSDKIIWDLPCTTSDLEKRTSFYILSTPVLLQSSHKYNCFIISVNSVQNSLLCESLRLGYQQLRSQRSQGRIRTKERLFQMYRGILKSQFNHGKLRLFTLASLVKDLKLLSNCSYNNSYKYSHFHRLIEK